MAWSDFFEPRAKPPDPQPHQRPAHPDARFGRDPLLQLRHRKVGLGLHQGDHPRSHRRAYPALRPRPVTNSFHHPSLRPLARFSALNLPALIVCECFADCSRHNASIRRCTKTFPSSESCTSKPDNNIGRESSNSF